VKIGETYGGMTVTFVEVNEQIEQRIRDNRRISTDKILPEMSMGHGN
jgi:hypothetical protein